MAALSQTAFSRLAGVSQQTVSLGVQSGHLVRDAAGGLDPAEPRNDAWIKTHQAGWGGRARPLSTWRNGRRGTGGDGVDLGAPEPVHIGLDELLARWGDVQIDPALADRLRDELATDSGRVIIAAVMAALPDEFAALRAALDAVRKEIDDLRVGRCYSMSDVRR
jgi:hypothetical protein